MLTYATSRLVSDNTKRLHSINTNVSRQSPVIGNMLQSRRTIQTKLTIASAGDKYEQEADRVADQVMRMPDTHLNTMRQSPKIQRMCTECEDEQQQGKKGRAGEEEEALLQMKEKPGRDAVVPTGVESRVENLRGGGEPLSEPVRNFFEPRFGRDLSRVRIHTNGVAGNVAESIQAKAFTIGNDIVFGAHEYSPGSLQGKKLLAHELTHVIQQNGGDRPSGDQKHGGQNGQQTGRQATIASRHGQKGVINRMAVTRVGKAPKLDCGAYQYRWKFALDNPAPDEGFFVQHVKVRESKGDCSKPEVGSIAVKPIAEFWESWHLTTKGDKVSIDTKRDGWTDQFSETPKPNSTGLHADVGKIKFFLKSTTGDLNKNWTPNHYSGILPATWTEPSWWKNKPIDTGFHWASSWWNCCGEKSTWWNKTDADP